MGAGTRSTRSGHEKTVGSLARDTRKRLELLGVKFGSPNAPLADVWQEYERSTLKLDCAEDFVTMRKIRASLGVRKAPHQPWVIERYVEIAGPDSANGEAVKKAFGQAGQAAIVAEVKRQLGLEHRGGFKMSEASLDEVIALFPQQVGDQLRSYLEHTASARVGIDRVGEIIEPDRKLAGRVVAIPLPKFQLAVALYLLAATLHGVRTATIRQGISPLRRVVAAIEGVDLCNEEAVRQAFSEYLLSDKVAGSRNVREDTVRFYIRVCAVALEFAVQVFGELAQQVTDLLPATFEFSHFLEAVGREEVEDARTKRVAPVMQAIETRAQTAAALKLRVETLAKVYEAFVQASRTHAVEITAGRKVSFVVEVAVLADDGHIVPGTQILRFCIKSKRTLLKEAQARRDALRSNENYWVRRGLSGTEDDPDPFLVFEGLEQTGCDGPCIIPFWLRLCRSSALERAPTPVGTPGEERYELLNAIGLRWQYERRDEFLGFPTSVRPLVSDALATGQVLVPIAPFYHAMLIAYCTLRYSHRFGARQAELLQFQLGNYTLRNIRGVSRIFLASVAKNRSEETDFSLDPGTFQTMIEIRRLIAERWHGGAVDATGLPFVPEVEFALASRRDMLPPGRYLFQGDGTALTPHEIGVFEKILSFGLPYTTVHNRRFALLTAARKAGLSKEVVGRLANHTEGFSKEDYYNLLKEEQTIDHLDEFVRYEERKRSRGEPNLLPKVGLLQTAQGTYRQWSEAR